MRLVQLTSCRSGLLAVETVRAVHVRYGNLYHLESPVYGAPSFSMISRTLLARRLVGELENTRIERPRIYELQSLPVVSVLKETLALPQNKSTTFGPSSDLRASPR
jgi:hypothetical protein